MIYDAFLCYSHLDSETVENVARRLRDEGNVRVWIDTVIQPGTHWSPVIERALSESRRVVVFWSKLAVESEWVGRFEPQAFYHRDPLGKKREVAIVNLDGTKIPGFLAEVKAIDWKKVGAYETLKAFCSQKWNPGGAGMTFSVNEKLIFSGPRLFEEVVPELRTDLARAGRVSVLSRSGVNLWRDFKGEIGSCPGVQNYMENGEQQSSGGAPVKFLVVDPEDEDASLISLRTQWLPFYPNEVIALAERRKDTREFLNGLSHCKGWIEARTLNYVPPWTILIIDPPNDEGEAIIYLEFMRPCGGSRDRPVVKLGSKVPAFSDMLRFQYFD